MSQNTATSMDTTMRNSNFTGKSLFVESLVQTTEFTAMVQRHQSSQKLTKHYTVPLDTVYHKSHFIQRVPTAAVFQSLTTWYMKWKCCTQQCSDECFLKDTSLFLHYWRVGPQWLTDRKCCLWQLLLNSLLNSMYSWDSNTSKSLIRRFPIYKMLFSKSNHYAHTVC